MSFLFLPGLIALVSLPVIVWLHLRRSRLKRVVVPSLMLWQRLPIPPSVKRRRWLPITLLLLMHLLVATLLGLALGFPYGTVQVADSRQHIAIIIDTSTSMGASDTTQGTRMDAARARTRDWIQRLNGDDRVTLIEAGQQARLLTAGGVASRAVLLQAPDRLSPLGEGSDLAGALTLARNTLLQPDEEGTPYDATRVVVLSDLEQPGDLGDLGHDLTWERIGGAPGNRAIVALAARPRGNRSTSGYNLFARVANYGDSGLTTRFNLYADGELIDRRNITLNPNGEVGLRWDLPAGTQVVRAEVDGQDMLPIDDTASLSVQQHRQQNTLLVSDDPAPLEQALQSVPGLNVVTIGSGVYQTSPLIEQADLIVFDRTLTATVSWPHGGVLVINPPLGSEPLLNVESVQPLEEPLTPDINEQDRAIFQNLNLEGVDIGPVARLQTPEWARVVLSSSPSSSSSSQDAQEVPLILRGQQDQSEITVWTFDPHQGNLTTRLAFPLLVARTVQDLSPPPLPPSLSIGTPLVVEPGTHAETVEVLAPDDTTRTFPVDTSTSAFVLDDLTQPGIYTIQEKRDGEVIQEGFVAFNAGTPQESDLRPRPAPAIAHLEPVPTVPAASGDSTQTPEQEQPLWSWFVLAALAGVMVEWMYVQWKTS